MKVPPHLPVETLLVWGGGAESPRIHFVGVESNPDAPVWSALGAGVEPHREQVGGQSLGYFPEPLDLGHERKLVTCVVNHPFKLVLGGLHLPALFRRAQALNLQLPHHQAEVGRDCHVIDCWESD